MPFFKFLKKQHLPNLRQSMKWTLQLGKPLASVWGNCSCRDLNQLPLARRSILMFFSPSAVLFAETWVLPMELGGSCCFDWSLMVLVRPTNPI